MDYQEIGFEVEEDENLTLETKLFLVGSCLLTEIFGCGLLIGLVQFERFGGDPMKRRLTDQLMSTAFLVKIVVHAFLLPITYISLLFDVKFPQSVCFFYTLVSDAAGLFYILIVIEICMVKYWIRFVWRAIRPLDDSFVCLSLTVINIFMSPFWAFLTTMGGNGNKYGPIILDKITEMEVFGQSKPVKMYIINGLLLILAFVSFLYILRTAFERCKEKRNQQLVAALNIPMDNLGANPDSAQNPRIEEPSAQPQGFIPAPALNLNNNVYNPEILTLPRFIMVLIFILVIVITAFLYLRNPNAKVLNIILGTLVSILPIVFYIKNPALWRFIRDEINEIFGF